ncbi:response regulator transcription factor [Oceanicoccus sagamiensis]|uniref:Response regulatory domain-containing protein n=1 Tax=Oceanicoccus sagamiensis TaxID=716816 RepID=A0A1X9NAQ8_9GAMM|nr:response regulator transcription factor [Oceanicoccus sagamiensis]ARN75130.1 hypothetical protein BST96_14000 [Oceanicoccus sagamiensis]
MRVIIANEHYLLRESLRMLLQTAGGYQVIAEPTDEWQLLNILLDHPADILLCDSGFPCKDLATMIARAAELQPKLELVLFTESLNAKSLRQRFPAPVAVVIDKDNAGDQLLHVLGQLPISKTNTQQHQAQQPTVNI